MGKAGPESPQWVHAEGPVGGICLQKIAPSSSTSFVFGVLCPGFFLLDRIELGLVQKCAWIPLVSFPDSDHQALFKHSVF